MRVMSVRYASVVPSDPVERWHELGAFIRAQRAGARLSLRRLSELAGVSNPYLSQIERGLRRPSADILQQLAKALRISAETLYVQAGILDPPSHGSDLVAQIRADPYLAESQKQALVQVYLSFRREHEEERGPAASSERPSRGGPPGPTDAPATFPDRSGGSAR
jgi:transcriptional regulator with XRE-family HTH domain